MCGRSSLAVDEATLRERFGVDVLRSRRDTGVGQQGRCSDNVPAVEPRYNIAPGDELLAVRNDRPGVAEPLTWGFVPAWAEEPDSGPSPINARSESVADSDLFGDAFESKRCLILADGFYEWAGSAEHKQPYRIERIDCEPYAYAGLWSRWTDSDTERRTCTILTTDANATVGAIHDRMPVIVPPGKESTWLSGAGTDDWRSVLGPYPDDELTAYPVSTRVNDPTTDGPTLAEAVGTQTGLGEFGG